MPQQCIEDQTTASHRPSNLFLWQALMLVQAIQETASSNGIGEQGEPKPSPATVKAAVDTIAEVPFSLLGHPDIDLFYGELHLTWNQGPKQIILMCFPNRNALIHHYSRVPGQPSEHAIEDATPARLAHWLGWLNA